MKKRICTHLIRVPNGTIFLWAHNEDGEFKCVKKIADDVTMDNVDEVMNKVAQTIESYSEPLYHRDVLDMFEELIKSCEGRKQR